MLNRLTATIVACAALIFTGSPAWSQPGSSDFDPRTELNRLTSSSRGYQRVRNLFYLGDLTSRSDDQDVARQAFRQAVLTYNELNGNHRRLAAPWAAQSMLGLAGLGHLEFRDLPLRWDHYGEDSTARWDLMTEARKEYNGVIDLGYARGTFEALYLRAHLLEEWEHGDLDRQAEDEPGLAPLERGITYLNVSRQLAEEAQGEYRRIITLEDSLGLSGGTGDDDVSRWVQLAQVRLDGFDGTRDSLVAREEALQALYAERKSAIWVERAVPKLWERAREITSERDAGDADPWLDYWLQYQLVNDAFRPFIFGETGFYSRHRASTDSARLVRGADWINERFQWQRKQEWLDAEIARRLAWAGLEQLRRVPATLDMVMQRLAMQADSLSPDWQAALRGVPLTPELDMPPIPTFGGRDPRLAYGDDRAALQEEYDQFLGKMVEVKNIVDAYSAVVTDFMRLADRVTGEDLPPELSEYVRQRRGLGATEVLLLDTLSARVIDQIELGLNKSRDAAVWLSPGLGSVNAQQAIRDYRSAVAAQLREIAGEAALEADRHELDAVKLNRNAPAASKELLAERLNAFADHLRREADMLSPTAQAASGR